MSSHDTTATPSDNIVRLPPMLLGPMHVGPLAAEDKIDWGLALHGIPENWATTRGKGIKVCVLDTGRPDHNDVQEAVVKSQNFTMSRTDLDLQGHSTHVCGTLGGRLNGRGTVGVAPECEIYIGKVLGDDGSGTGRGVAAGIRWGLEQDVDAFSMSLGGGYDSHITAAVKDAVQAGKFVICAAGNEGQGGVGYPAKLPETVAIAAYKKDGSLSSFSSRGPEVTVAFPGEDIFSCWLDQGFRAISGTSMATPFASGVVALMLSIHRQRLAEGNPVDPPINSNAALIEHLKAHARDMGAPGFDSGWGWGIPDTGGLLTVPDIPASGGIDLFGGLISIELGVQHAGKEGIFISGPLVEGFEAQVAATRQ